MAKARATAKRGKHSFIEPVETAGKQLALLARHQSRTRVRLLVLLGAVAAVGAVVAAVLFFSPESPSPPPALPAAAAPAPVPDAKRPALVDAPHAPPSGLARRLIGPPPVQTPLPPPATAHGIPHRTAEQDPLELAKGIAADKTGAVQLCYEHELKKDPRLRGKVTVALDLKAPRTVRKVSVRDTLHRASFTRCVQGALRKVFFPDISEDVAIEIPFVLKAPDL